MAVGRGQKGEEKIASFSRPATSPMAHVTRSVPLIAQGVAHLSAASLGSEGEDCFVPRSDSFGVVIASVAKRNAAIFPSYFGFSGFKVKLY